MIKLWSLCILESPRTRKGSFWKRKNRQVGDAYDVLSLDNLFKRFLAMSYIQPDPLKEYLVRGLFVFLITFLNRSHACVGVCWIIKILYIALFSYWVGSTLVKCLSGSFVQWAGVQVSWRSVGGLPGWSKILNVSTTALRAGNSSILERVHMLYTHAALAIWDVTIVIIIINNIYDRFTKTSWKSYSFIEYWVMSTSTVFLVTSLNWLRYVTIVM